MEDKRIAKLENEIALKQKCLHSAELQKLNKKVAILLMEDLKELKFQLKGLRQQQAKMAKRKSFVAAY
ncbi:hypothetical protein [Rufibacter hautae]|uniref:Uncharacterized protein n=1 Tax=Rufibacter hautae TaxID=2595005 RepID=A0A5B6TBH5_9BACT|nr:hypothetical protein [Rufibacter hautae]KAA3436960.1 hypothetical protein FOA19_21530 [Rufibacter hautae]